TNTYDEMMGCHFSLLDYQPGDEDILLDSVFYTATHDLPSADLFLDIFPNPAGHVLQVMADIPDHKVFWTLSNQLGMVMKKNYEENIANGLYSRQVNVSDLIPGMYTLTIISGEKKAVKKVMVMN